jgi:hypothetical protein
MTDWRPNGHDHGGAEPPPQGGVVIPFRRPPKRGPVLGPRSKIATRLRVAESVAFGLLFGLAAFLIERPLAALPYFALGFVIAAALWFAIAPRRGPIDNGTVIVTALATAFAAWAAYAVVATLADGAGWVAAIDHFINDLAYAFVGAWPVGIVAGLFARRLADRWRPKVKG